MKILKLNKRIANTFMAALSIYVRDYGTEIPGSLTDPNTWTFPTVESKNTHGKITEWRIYVRIVRAGNFMPILQSYFQNNPMEAAVSAWIKVDSGLRGGKIKDSEPTIVTAGKNLGKTSATNVFCQALRDAYGTYNKQVRKALTAIGAATQRYPPMLAQIFKDQKNELEFARGVYMQRKYNGVRTVTTLDCADIANVVNCKPIMYSRRKLLYPGFEYIKAELAPVLETYWKQGHQLYLDGEIYKHGTALQDISGMARRESRPGDVEVQYMIYDCFVSNTPELDYAARMEILQDIFSRAYKYAVRVETFEIDNMQQIHDHYKKFIQDGYEGAMIRTNDPYKYSYNEHHCKYLLKMKETLDTEMEIVGWETGEKGKAAGAIMIICRTPEGKKFPCTPAMEIVDRIALAKLMDTRESNAKTHFENHWLGHRIVVYFDEYSKDRVPQRARTKMEIRDVIE